MYYHKDLLRVPNKDDLNKIDGTVISIVFVPPTWYNAPGFYRIYFKQNEASNN